MGMVVIYPLTLLYIIVVLLVLFIAGCFGEFSPTVIITGETQVIMMHVGTPFHDVTNLECLACIYYF